MISKFFASKLIPFQRTRRFTKWIFWGTVFTGFASVSCSPDRDPLYLSYALIRSFRVLSTGTQIALDYHFTLKDKKKKSSSSSSSSSSSIAISNSNEDKRTNLTELTLYDELKSQVHLRSAQALLTMLQKNGGVYVKLGQILSSLSYLIPLEYTETLKVLQDQCPPSSLNSIQDLFLEDVGVPWHEVFDSIDPIPLGVASLAQVHRATLKDGTQVALKIQHPNIRKFSFMDIQLTATFVKFIKWVFPDFELDWLAKEMQTNLPLELDFQHEAQNAIQVQKNFADSSLNVKIPKVFFAHKRILCMEYIDGKRIDDLDYMKKNNIEPTRVATELTRIFSKMIFEDGFVHADPHPGNLMILSTRSSSNTSPFDSSVSKLVTKFFVQPFLSFVSLFTSFSNLNFDIVLLDHGLYRDLDTSFRLKYAKLWKSLILGSESEIRLYSTELTGTDMYGLFACMLTGRTWNTIIEGQLRSNLIGNELGQVTKEAQAFWKEINAVLMQVPRPLLLIFKTNDMIRNVYRGLGLSEWASLTVMSEWVWKVTQPSFPLWSFVEEQMEELNKTRGEENSNTKSRSLVGKSYYGSSSVGQWKRRWWEWIQAWIQRWIIHTSVVLFERHWIGS